MLTKIIVHSPLPSPTLYLRKLDGLREMIVAPRPPKRSNSFGSSVASANPGGLSGKNVSVERLRHSISVARGRNKSIVTAKNENNSRNGSSGSSADGRNHGATSGVIVSPGEQALHCPHPGGVASTGPATKTAAVAAAAAAAAATAAAQAPEAPAAATAGKPPGGGWTAAQSSRNQLPAPEKSKSMWPVRGNVR